MPAKQSKLSRAVRIKYNILSRLYDYIWPGYIRKTVGEAMAPLNLSGSEKILDIGCGTGQLEKSLLQKWPNLKITGIDLSEDMLGFAQKRIGSNPNIIFKQGDFLETSLEENSFDVAFSISNLHYFSNPLSVFEKVKRVLKPGGLFIIVDWNRDSFQGKIYNWYMGKADPAFAKIYRISEAYPLLEEAGLKPKNHRFFGVGLRWRMMCLVAQKP